MKKKVSIISLSLVFILVIGYVAAGPYLTMSRIKTGIVEKDSEQLSEDIDFPILRQNLKDQFNAARVKKSAGELKDNPFSALAAGLISKMVDGMVDMLVTPSGLASMMASEKPTETGSDGAANASSPDKENMLENASYAYDSMSKFSILVKDNEGKEVRFVLKRDGFSWKLVNIIIPMDN